MKYRPEIDGLRAVAVLPVILFHLGYTTFQGGFVGVDVFFVISGYLITTIILGELAQDRFSIAGFYERRARRILPALLLVVAASWVAAWMLLVDRDFKDFAESVAAVATFCSNILFWRESGYFDTAAELKPLLHTWSLAVEEQYYIFFPPLLALIWSASRRLVLPALVLALLLSLGLAEWGVRHAPTAAFYLLPTRAWELMVGAICAYHLRHNAPPGNGTVAAIGGLAGLAMILGSIFFYDAATPFPGVYALLPCLGTAFIILFARAGTPAARLLAHRVPLGLGLISYSAYLWHQPLIVFRRYTVMELSHLDAAVIFVASLVLAWISWRFIEAPFRDRSFLRRGQVLGLSGVALVAVLGVGLAGHVTDGFPGRDVRLTDVALLDYDPDNRALREGSWAVLRDLTGQQGYAVEDNAADLKPWFDPQDARPNLLVVGDSHSKDIWNILHFSAPAASTFEIARYGGRIGTLPGNARFFGAPNYEAADVVVFAGRYSAQDYAALPVLADRARADGKRVVVVRRIFDFPLLRGGLMNRADETVIEAVHAGIRDGARIAASSDHAYYEDYEGATRAAEPEIDALAARGDPGIIVLDRMAYVCTPEDRSCLSLSESLDKYFYDYGHHTLAGAKAFAARVDASGWLAPLLEAYPSAG